MSPVQTILSATFGNDRHALLDEWVGEQMNAPGVRTDLMTESQTRSQSEQFLDALARASTNGSSDVMSPQWAAVRELLESVSHTRALQGYSPSETASFVLSLKKPLFLRLRGAVQGDPGQLAESTWLVGEVLDRLGLFTTEVFQKSREDLIMRQQDEMMELSTPVIKVWEGVLAVPLIGTLDSARTQAVTENLLEQIVATGSAVAIIDITGVATVDTLVAQHLMKAVAAARLMGAECIISGIRPQIAQTIVQLGIELEAVATKATLADALSLALRQSGWTIQRARA